MRVPAYTFPSGCVHRTLAETSDWVDLVSPSSLFQDSVDCADLRSRQSDPDASSDRRSVAVALSSLLTVAMTPCSCGALGGLYVLVGSSTYPSPGRMFGPSCCGHLTCRESGLTYRPPPHTSRTLSIALTDGRDSLLLRHPAIDIVWRWPCLPRFRLLQTPCYCGVLGGL